MHTRGAIVRQAPGKYEVVDLEVDDPRENEIQVQMVASGMCHSDDHVATGDIPVNVYPFAGGHEGAGIVTKAGVNTKGLKEGDHVVFSFLPSCGHCRWCASGMQNLCELGSTLLDGARWGSPGDYRVKLAETGQGVGQMCGISTFLQTTTVSADSAVKVPDDIPLDKACLVGCGVGTGWGSAVNSAEVQPGHTVIVMGIGGIGINAVQGAAHAGASNIIAVDPVAFKREKAQELGATHAFESIEEAADFARSVTNGQGADKALITVGVLKGEHVAQAFEAIGKGGRVVITGLGDLTDVGIPINPSMLALFTKEIRGALFGDQNPSADMLKMLRLYQEGKIKLDELISREYRIEQVNEAFHALEAGEVARSIVRFN